MMSQRTSSSIGSPECFVLARSKRSFGHITHMTHTGYDNHKCQEDSVRAEIIFLDFTVTHTLRSLRASWVLAEQKISS